MSEVPSEKIQAKAAQYLLNGQVQITKVTSDPETDEYGAPSEFVIAEVTPKDGGDPYYVTLHGGWSCDCPARVPVCAHILAVKTVVAIKPLEKTKPTMSMADMDAFLSGGTS